MRAQQLGVLLVNCLCDEADVERCEVIRRRFDAWLGCVVDVVWFGSKSLLFPLPPSDVWLVVVTGSATKAYDETTPWVGGLVSWLSSILEQCPLVRVLGICFGSQVLAMACGGTCEKLARPEVGGVCCNWTIAGAEVPFRLVAAHGETVGFAGAALRNARVLAENVEGGVQGFVACGGRALGGRLFHLLMPLCSHLLATVTCHPEYGRPEGEERAKLRHERGEISDAQLVQALDSLALPLGGAEFAKTLVLPWANGLLTL